jgi:hypothetical protein
VRSLQEAIGRELVWKPRSLLSRTHDLVDPEAAGGEPYATLVWRPGFLARGPAEARSGDGCWFFRQRGFLQTTVVVMLKDGAAPVATLRRYFRRAVLRFEDGREFVWRRESLWRPAWRFEDANGSAVLRLRTRFAWPWGSARVELEASAAPAADRALLACLAWCLVLMARRRAAARAGG